MGIEIERKFLVVSDAWRTSAFMCETIRQGYLARTDDLTVRVRIADETGFLTVKSRRRGAQRDEFEYTIPVKDAEALLTRCSGELIQKLRHHVPVGSRTWTVDEFKGRLAELVLAECELEAEDAALTLPDWIGAEVTNDPNYRNEAL